MGLSEFRQSEGGPRGWEQLQTCVMQAKEPGCPLARQVPQVLFVFARCTDEADLDPAQSAGVSYQSHVPEKGPSKAPCCQVSNQAKQIHHHKLALVQNAMLSGRHTSLGQL